MDKNKGVRRDILIAFHTEIMNYLKIKKIALVVSDHPESKLILQSFFSDYKVEETSSGGYTSSLYKEWHGKEVFLLSISKGMGFITQLRKCLKEKIPVIMTFDVFPKMEDSYDLYTYSIAGRPLLKAPALLYKLCKKYKIGIIPFFNYRDIFGRDTVILGKRIITNDNDKIRSMQNVYDELFNFMFRNGILHDGSWQGIKLLSRNIPLFWKPEEPDKLAKNIIKKGIKGRYIINGFEKNTKLIFHDYPFICIKVNIKHDSYN